MKANETTSAPTPSGVSRRTVVKGAAWAVPVVAVASAVPAMAASPCVTFTLGPRTCKDSGNPFRYELDLCFKSECPGSVYPVAVYKITTNSNPYGLTVEQWANANTPGATLLTGSFQVEGCQLLQGYSWSSANFIYIHYSLNGVQQTPYEIDARPIQGGCTV